MEAATLLPLHPVNAAPADTASAAAAKLVPHNLFRLVLVRTRISIRNPALLPLAEQT
jgi:hypothetical protein